MCVHWRCALVIRYAHRDLAPGTDRPRCIAHAGFGHTALCVVDHSHRAGNHRIGCVHPRPRAPLAAALDPRRVAANGTSDSSGTHCDCQAAQIARRPSSGFRLRRSCGHRTRGGIIFAAICYLIGDRKGRNPVLWGALGFFFSLISLIVIAVLPRKSRHTGIRAPQTQARAEKRPALDSTRIRHNLPKITCR